MGIIQGENGMKKRQKVIKIILFLLQIISIIWLLLFILHYLADAKISSIMCSNPIVELLLQIYWGGIPSLLSVLIAFVNVIYSGHDFLSLYKSEQLSKKGFAERLMFMLFALGVFIVHLFTLDFLFSCMIAG